MYKRRLGFRGGLAAFLCCAMASMSAQGVDGALENLLEGLPAENQREFEARFSALAALGAPASARLAEMLTPPGAGDDEAARYALSGLAKHVTRPGAEAERRAYALGVAEALAAPRDPEVARFLLAQLELAGGPECVAPVSRLLADPALYDDAARVLRVIGGPESGAALLAALQRSQDARALVFIAALRALAYAPAAETLRRLAASDDAALAAEARTALARLESLDARDAPAGAPAMDPRIAEAEALLARGQRREAEALAGAVYAEAVAASDAMTAVAALPLQAEAARRGVLDLLMTAAASPMPEVRAAALGLAEGHDSRSAVRRWVRFAETAPEEALPGVLRLLGALGHGAALPALRAGLASESEAVRLAAIQGLGALGGKEAAALLQARRPQAKTTAEAALLRNTVFAMPEAKAWIPAPDDEGFVPLFNGRDLEGWIGHTLGYEVEDGVVSSKRVGLNLYSEAVYGDFILRFDFKLTEGANNGIGIRVPLYGHAAYDGMEIQVLDDHAEAHANLKPWQYHGAVYGVAAPELGHLKPAGEWNTQEIIARGPSITVILNGHTILEADVVEAATPAPAHGREHPGLTRTSGHLALCGHNSVVSFRGMRIKPLD